MRPALRRPHARPLRILPLGVALSGLLSAQGPGVQVSGFGTLGMVWNNQREAEFIRDLSQPRGAAGGVEGRTDTRLGLHLESRLGENLRFVTQGISKYRHDGTFRPDLQWAFLRWHPNPETQLRVGRVGFDVYMDADSRDVGFAQLPARPPVEFFGPLPLSHLDGLDLSHTLPVGMSGTLRIKGFYGQAQGEIPVRGEETYRLSGSRIGGLVGEYAHGALRIRLAYSRVRLAHEIGGQLATLRLGLEHFGDLLQDAAPREASRQLALEGRTVQYRSLGTTWESGRLRIMGMAARYTLDSHLYPDHWSGFLSVGVRQGAWIPYIMWSRIASQRAPLEFGSLSQVGTPESQALITGAIQSVQANTSDQMALSMGLRWDFLPHACLKFQVDRIRSHQASGLWARGPLNWDGHPTVVTLACDFIF